MTVSVRDLSGYTKFHTGIDERWRLFAERRRAQLSQALRYGSAPEKVAEDILKDFFTIALDWPLTSLNNQLGYADIVLSDRWLKRLVVEVKRPDSLTLDKTSFHKALDQAYRYAQEQHVSSIAVSDGKLFYAADIKNGGLVDRILVSLDTPTVHPDLYWVSIDGINRVVENLGALPTNTVVDHVTQISFTPADTFDSTPQLLHPKYGIPFQYFAYVGDPNKTSTWKLPYKNADGSIDTKRLPKAIGALITNYRGARSNSILESAIPDVLVRLGKAAWQAGKMPGQVINPADAYQRLSDALYQIGRLDEIKQP